MNFRVNPVGKYYSLHLDNFGIELRFVEAAEIRRSLANIFKDMPYCNDVPEDRNVLIPGNTYVEEDGDEEILFSVGQCYWKLNRPESEKLLHVLDAALMESQ